MMVGWVEPVAILSILWAIFSNLRIFIGIACSKEDLRDPSGIQLKSQSLNGLIRNIESSIILRRDNISWDFQREYLA